MTEKEELGNLYYLKLPSILSVTQLINALRLYLSSSVDIYGMENLPL